MAYWRNGVSTLASRLKEDDVGGVLITSDADIRYLTGYRFPGSVLLVLSSGKAVLFISGMDTGLAEKGFSGHGPVETRSDARGALGALISYLSENGLSRLYLNDQGTISLYRRLRCSVEGLEILFYPEDSGWDTMVSLPRTLKTTREIAVMRGLAAESRRILDSIVPLLEDGMTDWQIVAMVDGRIRECGALNAFDTIVAVDTDSADPHARPTGRRLKRDSHVMFDIGMRKDGYCSDLTRTIGTGRMDQQIRKFHDTVQKAQDRIISGIRPGARIAEVLEGAMDVIRSDGFEDCLLHGFGHGIGLEVHEAPFLSATSEDMFIEGMVVTVEPGLYQNGIGGVRTEDMVLVTDKGCEVLTR